MKPATTGPVQLNPYASPEHAGGYDSRCGAGIGVWRDGNLIVMHRSATLPAVCIRTGEATSKSRKYGLLWSYPIDWSSRRLWLELPLSESEYRAYSLRWRIGIIAVVLPLTLLVGGIGLFGEQKLPDELVVAVMLMAPIGVLLWRVLRWWDSKPLKFVRVRESYLWLSGANERFLAQLPPWTSGL